MSRIKRVVAFHDMCGYGKCSLGTVLPVLSACGFEVCAVPTGVYSKHTALENPTVLDTTDILDDYLASWRSENFEVDAIYSGFLSSGKQVYTLMQLYADYPNAVRIVDPAMADNGKLYATCNKELLSSMKKLIDKAELLIPNVTEACLLVDENYKMLSVDEAKSIAFALQKNGAKNIIITGIISDDKIHNLSLSADGRYCLTTNECLPYQLHGAGDLYASVLVAKYLSGCNLEDSCQLAANFVYEATKLSAQQPGFESRGISFEPLLGCI